MNLEPPLAVLAALAAFNALWALLVVRGRRRSAFASVIAAAACIHAAFQILWLVRLAEPGARLDLGPLESAGPLRLDVANLAWNAAILPLALLAGLAGAGWRRLRRARSSGQATGGPAARTSADISKP